VRALTLAVAVLQVYPVGNSPAPSLAAWVSFPEIRALRIAEIPLKSDDSASACIAGSMVVSMRPITPANAIRSVQITTRFPSVHGAPVHLGKPELIGIKDIAKPDWGVRVPIGADDIPVFWACGVTPQSVIMAVRPEFCITHFPGAMLVTDRRNTEFAIM